MSSKSGRLTEGQADRLLGAGPAPPPPRPRCSQHRAAASSGALMHPHRNYPRQPVGWGTLHEAHPGHRPLCRDPPGRLAAASRAAAGLGLPPRTRPADLLTVAYVWLGGTLGRENADQLIVAAAFVVAVVGWTREP